MNDDEDLPPDDLRLADLVSELAPPRTLEDRVVAVLSDRGLLQPSPFRRRPLGRTGLALAFAAALAAFVAGGLVGRLSAPALAPPPSSDLPTFAFFLFEDASFAATTADGERERVGEYVAWGRSLGERGGRTVGGEKLAGGDPGLLLDGVLRGAPATPAPPDPALGTMGGFFLVEAPSLEAAVELARSCPHLKYGGRIVVREVERVAR